MYARMSNAGRVTVAVIVVMALLLGLTPIQPARANGASHVLHVAQWSTSATLANVSGRETVLKVDTSYHMWYSPSDTAMYHTWSSAPDSFSAGTLCTFTGGSPAEVGGVAVAYEDTTFYLIAYGATSKVFNIYTSSDGTAWTNKGCIFGGSGLPGYNKIDAPCLLQDGTAYRLYFQVKTPEVSPTRYDIYTAEASGTLAGIADGTGADFALANGNAPVLSPTSGSWDGAYVMQPWVVKDGSVYYLWYSAHAGGATQQKIGVATSTDGYTWQKSPGNPVISSGSSTNDAEPTVINDNGTWRMWFDIASSSSVTYLTATGPFEFSSIQSAVTAASAGDTIQVAAGTYAEQVVITKAVALRGAGSTTIIKPSALTTYLTGPSEAESTVSTGVVIVHDATGVTVKDLVVDAAALPADRSTWFSPAVDKMKLAGVYYYKAGGTIDRVISTHTNHITIPSAAANTWGRQVQSFKIDSDGTAVSVMLSNSTASAFLGEGVEVGWNPGNGVTVSLTGNTITGDGLLTAHRQNGIQVYYAAAVISSNTLSDLVYRTGSNWSTGIMAVSVPSGGAIASNTVTNCDFGITDTGSSGLSITGNTVTGSGHAYGTGIYVDNSGADLAGIVVQGNHVGSGFPYGGICLRGWYASTHTMVETIQDNVLTGNGTTDGYGIFDESGAGGGISATITGNTVTGWQKGIFIASGAPVNGLALHQNSISGNGIGVDNGATGLLDATNNWWGDASGPKDTKTLPGTPNYNNPAGTGNAVSPYVDYKPWQVTPGATGYALTVTTSGGGTVLQSPAPVAGLYAAGTVVQLTAVPGPGAAFVGWSGDVTGTSNPATVTVTGNTTITASFGTASYPITATAGTGGTIEPSGTITVLHGASQSFVITAGRGYFIDHLVVDGAVVTPGNAGTWTYTFAAVTAPHAIEAVFVVQPDRTPPEVTLPTVGGVDLNSGTALLQLGSSTLSLDLNATDASGIGRVTVRVNGVAQADAWGLAAAPVLTLPDGMNTIEVTVEDTQGNRTSRSFRALVDTHGPAVSLSAPVPASVTGTTFTLGGSISDLASGYASLTVNGTPVIPTLTGDFEVQVPLTRGANTITLEAVDRLGNRTTQTFVVTSVVPQTRQHLITLEIGSPSLTVDGISQPIDAQGSAPVIQEGRTLLPIRVIVESLGGRIEWNARERKVTIVLSSRTLELWIGKSTATVAGVKTPIDAANPRVAPVIIKGRTYLPVRFIAENLGGSVSWDPATQTVTIASMN